MKSSGIAFIVGIIFIILTDTAFGLQIRRFIRKKWQLSLYVFQTLFFITAILLFHFSISKIKGPESYFWIGKLFGVLVLFYVPKLLYIIVRGIGFCLKKIAPKLSNTLHFIAGCLTILSFCFLLYGITWGRYNYRIDKVEVPIDNLPNSFKNFTIVQLSDIHLGSYGESYKGMEQLVNEVNSLKPDIIVFTGDMVNNFADEMPYWIPTLKQLKAPYGKYAVTGNHDYGDYTRWASQEAKQDNMKRFYHNMHAMGFKMLNNSHIPIIRQGDTLWLAGVENWGKPPFPRYGNLSKALKNLKANQSIILLSHDPSHWKAEVLSSPVSLMLSGHTHAMQSGIRIGNKEWSPSKYIYPEYDGLYQKGNQYLYVSRGQGYIGYPGRIGLRPVITLLTLK
ncbi:MAG: metallophosphoesterase [Odoribacter sp.]|nr:metallophosphoesterase [Odoribacter sp.]